MVEQNRDIRTARSLQTDGGNDRQRQTDSVEIDVSAFSGQYVKYNVKNQLHYYLLCTYIK